MNKLTSLFLIFLTFFSCATLDGQSKKESKKAPTSATTKIPPKPKSKFKNYDKVITKDAKSDDGLFDVHKVGGKYYFEIPKRYLDTDMLLVSRCLG